MLGVSGPSGSTVSPPALFIDAPASGTAGSLIDPAVVRRRAAGINEQLLADLASDRIDTLQFNLLADTVIVGRVDRTEVRSSDDYTLFGRLSKPDEGSFILVVRQDVLVGHIQAIGRGTYRVRFLGNHVHVIEQIDETWRPPCATAAAPARGAPQAVNRRADAPPGITLDDGSQIDILVVYTARARDAVGGVRAIESLIHLSVNFTNSAFLTSLIQPRVNLVKTMLINFDEGQSNFFLDELIDPNDGIMDEVHAWRDQYAADMVALVADGTCGVGFQLSSLDAPGEGFAFFQVGSSCLGSVPFAHELGHGLGCAHSRDSLGSPGAFEYSWGHNFTTDSGFHRGTIMGAGLIANYSNPDVLFDGQPTGVPAGDPRSADNARTINETAFIVANFRLSVPPDCNLNGIPDVDDIASMPGLDGNGNGILDTCEITVHVKADAPAGGDGATWATAYTDLQDALADAAVPGSLVTQIWVATGTYRPDRETGDRSATFQLRNVAMLGGFAGDETTLSQRAGLVDSTILSGDLNGDDGSNFQNNTENSYHVVSGDRTNAEAILDGFTITGGNANAKTLPNDTGGGMTNGRAALTIRNCNFIRNFAEQGGAVSFSSSQAKIINCVFQDNEAGFGGAIFDVQSTATFTNCLIHGNAAFFGGGVLSTLSDPTLTNCTITGNTADGLGGGLFIDNVTTTITNCIVWGNAASGVMNESAQINVSSGTPCVRMSNVQGCWSGCGISNLCADPLFVDFAGGDLHLLPGSPSVNTGDNAVVTVATDLDGRPRITMETVDMGVYEHPIPIPTVSQAGLMVMTLLLLATGVWVCKRRPPVNPSMPTGVQPPS